MRVMIQNSVSGASTFPRDTRVSGRSCAKSERTSQHLMEQAPGSKPLGEGGAEFVVYCVSDEVRDHLLRDHAGVLKRASDHSRLRLHSLNEDASKLAPALFDVAETLRALRTHAMGHVIVYADSTSSTQDVLQTVFRGLPAGTVAVTNEQNNGRGRRGSIWESPRDALAFSLNIVVPLKEPHRLTFVQYVAALAAVDCITQNPQWSRVPLRIKWPNDLLVNRVKVGGVLCEASTQGDHFNVVVGVGINISNPKPTTCLNSALFAHGGDPAQPITREAYLAAYLKSFESLHDQFRRPRGFDELKKRYISVWMHTDQEVRLENAGNRVATVVGLAPNGYVRVRCHDNGNYLDLAPDLTTLDLNVGVVRAKAQGPRGLTRLK
jgi:biotin---protein ligase